ncbi:MAG: N-acetylmuramoyl-L-alanine amidase [Anaerovoracaceae bacterium]|jgi:N-acetylmuramoyl-L-alanine amidase
MNAVRKTGLIIIAFVMAMAMGMTLQTFANEKPITMTLNNEIVKTEVEPIIEGGRTLIPARAFFEAMGGVVTWDNQSQEVGVQIEMDKVQLTIGSKEGLVNGVKRIMDVPARIVKNRTMIPVRFVSESLGCEVDWDDTTRTVIVNLPTKEEQPREPKIAIGTIKVVEKEDYYRITIDADRVIDKIAQQSYVNPKRFSVDIKDARIANGGGRINVDNEVFGAIRYSQFDNLTVRVVVDLDLNLSGKVSKSSDGTSLYIDFPRPTISADQTGGAPSSIPILDERMANKLILIDPGHGGKDPGAQGKIAGTVVLNEKDVNLSVALKVWEHLNTAGANVDMTRFDDSTLSTRERPELANNMGADLFVSIHNNSNTSPKPNGTEVLYSNKVLEEGYLINSKVLADTIQREMAKEVGLYNRGARQSPDLIVLKYSKMPAVIIEGAFLSNESDLKYMMTNEYVERYAKAVALGIIKTMNKYADEEDLDEWRDI